jgi:hypothetical protein
LLRRGDDKKFLLQYEIIERPPGGPGKGRAGSIVVLPFFEFVRNSTFSNLFESIYNEREFKPVPGFKGFRKKSCLILLVFWPVYCVTSTDTYLDMRRWMCLVDEPKSGAILWNYFLP